MNKLFYLSLILNIALVGCYNPERDLGLDPINKPVLHILDAQYDSEAGVVAIQWEYIGTKSVAYFAVERRTTNGYSEVGRFDNLSAPTQYVTTGNFQDDDLLAGERLSYRMVTEQPDGTKIVAQSVDVLVPGARAGSLNRDPQNLALQVNWISEGADIVGYSVVRSVGGADGITVFQTDDAGVRAFWDRDIHTNLPHTYVVETRLASGVALKSRPVTTQFYSFGGQWPVESVRPAQESLRLTDGAPSVTGGTLALISRSDQSALFQLRYEVGVAFDGTPVVHRTLAGTAFLVLPALSPHSVDIIGPGFDAHDVFPRIFIGGVNALGKITVVGFAAPLFQQVWEGPTDWFGSPDEKVRLSRDGSGNVYVVLGDEVRVYDAVGGQIGASAFSTGPVSDFAVGHGVMWVGIQNEPQLLRGELVFAGGVLLDLVWADVPVSEPAVGLALNSFGQLIVLEDNGQIEILSTEGRTLLSWILPGSGYEDGDVTIDGSGTNLIQISNGEGDVLSYVP